MVWAWRCRLGWRNGFHCTCGAGAPSRSSSEGPSEWPNMQIWRGRAISRPAKLSQIAFFVPPSLYPKRPRDHGTDLGMILRTQPSAPNPPYRHYKYSHATLGTNSSSPCPGPRTTKRGLRTWHSRPTTAAPPAHQPWSFATWAGAGKGVQCGHFTTTATIAAIIAIAIITASL